MVCLRDSADSVAGLRGGAGGREQLGSQEKTVFQGYTDAVQYEKKTGTLANWSKSRQVERRAEEEFGRSVSSSIYSSPMYMHYEHDRSCIHRESHL